MRPDFESCADRFLNSSVETYNQYRYNSTLYGVRELSRRPLITVHGCRQLCGTGTAYYPWKDAANTVSTWVLPIIGLLVQAPFESNEAWMTILSLSRWVGSPMATLSYILWNIKVTGKCALMIDMAVRYHEYPEEGSNFSQMRDSMYILCIMNQYSIKQALPPIESERLLRLALFSDLLQLNGSSDPRDSVVARRTNLARALREGRKKGVVPVFISFLWFVFALGLSIELAFDDIGGNQTAHNLAIGLMVAWLPIMIVASTVDRNSVSADSIRERLNALVDDVRRALLDPSTLADNKIGTYDRETDYAWTAALKYTTVFDGEFFTSFSGQGRTHFHYGVAHPILSSLETKFMAEYGRDWIRHGHAARQAMIVASRNEDGLKMFDLRMVYQVASSLIMVAGTSFGAFILSWFTPTKGLGCRTGGYLIYITLALSLLTIEIFVWGMTHRTTHTSHDLVHRAGSRLERRFTVSSEKGLLEDTKKHRIVTYLHSTAFRDTAKNFVIRPLEAVNTAWLTYIIFAQTFGGYETCACKAANWARGEGGYIDFSTYDLNTASNVTLYWASATTLSCTILTIGLVYIVTEYCTQSHLSTENYGRAMQGLRWVRFYKKHTRWTRFLPNQVLKFGKWVGWKCSRGKTRRVRRSHGGRGEEAVDRGFELSAWRRVRGRGRLQRRGVGAKT